MRSLARPARRRWGPLETIEFAAPAGVPAIICFHGYGADAADLAPLAAELDLPSAARWVFPDGLLGMEGGFGRAWFPIDESRFSGAPIDLSREAPRGMEQAAAAARGLLEALGTPIEDVILGGFSQGSMLALELALGAERPPRGLFLLSGTLVDEERTRARAGARAGLAFFQSHGRQDPILPYQGARRLNALLREAGLKGELLSFDGGHALPAPVLAGLGAYLGAAVGR